MSRRPATVTQADVARAIRAAQQTGVKVARVEIEPKTGKIVIVSDAGSIVPPETGLDQWLAKNADKT